MVQIVLYPGHPNALSADPIILTLQLSGQRVYPYAEKRALAL